MQLLLTPKTLSKLAHVHGSDIAGVPLCCTFYRTSRILIISGEVILVGTFLFSGEIFRQVVRSFSLFSCEHQMYLRRHESLAPSSTRLKSQVLSLLLAHQEKRIVFCHCDARALLLFCRKGARGAPPAVRPTFPTAPFRPPHGATPRAPCRRAAARGQASTL